MRRGLANLALAAVSTAVSLVAAEGAFRVIVRRQTKDARADAAWRERLHRMNAGIYRRSDDPRLIYEPRPSSAVEMPYGIAGFNAAGMREEHEVDPAPGRATRIAVIGDSLAWSEDVSVHDSLPQRIGEALGERAEVLNFGVSGYDTAQEAAWYARAVRPFHPRVVALVYCLNDVMIMSGPFGLYATPAEAARKDAQDAWFDRVAPLREETIESVARTNEAGAMFHMLARAEGWWRRLRFERSSAYADEYTLMYARPDRIETLRSSLGELGAAIAADGAEAHFYISPVLRDWSRYHWAWIHTLVAREARRAGFIVHDPLTVWQTEERPERLRLYGDSIHYGVRGNRVFGQFIADTLASAGGASVSTRTWQAGVSHEPIH